MPYQFQPGQIYTMPTHFGPSLGPRQGPDGRKFECKDGPKSTTIVVTFLTNRDQLSALLPEGFEVAGEPVVTVFAIYMKEIGWLAGRGYNVLGVSFPATFNGEQDIVTGDFLTVLWENMADPIITGREQLGFSKIYCELPEPSVYQGTTHCTAEWQGFRFLDLTVSNLRQLTPNEMAEVQKSEGMLHFKYIPRTGEWGTADVAYATFTPAATPNRVVQEMWRGEGTVQFHRARWEDMPTQYTIVNAFQALEIVEYRGAMLLKTVGGKDLSDQRILK